MSQNSASNPLRTETYDGENPGDLLVNRVQDVEPIRDQMRELKNAGRAGWSPSRDLKLAYKIPLIFVERWSIEDGVNYLELDKREFTRRVEAKIQKEDLTDFKMNSATEFRLYQG